ncbi:MAG: GAF domain-containing sensor histidine kinase [Solirubrobacteraceae bacterium]
MGTAKRPAPGDSDELQSGLGWEPLTGPGSGSEAQANPAGAALSVTAGAVPVEALELFAAVLSQSEPDSTVGDDFYDRLCDAICRLANLRRAIIFRYDQARRQVRAAGSHGVRIESFAGANFSVDTAAIAERALREDRVVETAGDISGEIPEQYAFLVPEPMRVVCAPMVAAGLPRGVIVAERSLDAPPLGDAERDLLWTLGKAAALASVAQNVATQALAARQLRQRLELAREIHEGVIQRLFGISMVLDGAGDLPQEVRVRCATEIQAALSDLREAIQRPLGRASRKTRTTLVAELERQAQLSAGVQVSFDREAAAGVPRKLQSLAQSVLAEAMLNVRKHSAATWVTVDVRQADGAFVFEIVNDGLAGRGPSAQGMGLRLAAFEALQAGGFLEFGARDGGVWQVRLVVPYDG